MKKSEETMPFQPGEDMAVELYIKEQLGMHTTKVCIMANTSVCLVHL